MKKNEVLQKIHELGLLAVIRGPSAHLTIEMVDALVAGGVSGIEITYTTPDAESVVSRLNKKYGDEILLGMGTVTNADQVISARQAGAKFLVSPICDAQLVRAMVSSGLVVMAGALTPSEVFQAYSLGSDVVKIFPGSLGGASYMKALKGPFPQIPMMPTGGVSPENIGDWFASGAVAVGAGSGLCPTKLAKEGKFSEITEIAKEYVKYIENARRKIG